eukprot:365994-Chlamydomonas_euryale.AAC.17
MHSPAARARHHEHEPRQAQAASCVARQRVYGTTNTSPPQPQAALCVARRRMRTSMNTRPLSTAPAGAFAMACLVTPTM